MISEKKLQANKLNAQKSTGPRSDEGKAAVSLNSITHGLRARHAVMLIEDPNEFRALCQQLYDEWQPLSHTEAHLLEEMAVNRWKMGRMEALVSTSNLQSSFMHLAFKDLNQYRNESGGINIPDLSKDEPEQKTQRMLEGVQRHQSLIEKSYYRAMAALEHIQEVRRNKMVKLAQQPQEQERAKVMTAEAGTGWLEIQPEPKPAGAVRRRMGNAWVHASGLPEDVKA